MKFYGSHIEETVLEDLKKYNINGVNVYVYDNGALECTIRYRLHDELLNQGYIFN